MSFGSEVRRRRKAQGLILEELAERADLSPHYLSTVETGKRDPSLSTIRALADGLGCAPGELLGTVKDVSPAAMEAAHLFEAAPDDVRDGVLMILRACARRRR